MEWLTAVWGNLRDKPLYFLLGGTAVIWFAPANYSWVGMVSAALGVAGSIEWAAGQVRGWQQGRVPSQELRAAITSLNGEEKSALKEQLQKGEQTFYLDWRDYHGARPRLGGETEYRRRAGVYLGLVHKGFLSARSDHTITTFTVTDAAWRVLRKEQKSKPRFLD